LRGAPSLLVTAPIPMALVPRSSVNRPPSTTSGAVGLIVSAVTEALGAGRHPSTAPPLVETAPAWGRSSKPSVLKSPPTYSVESVAARARTVVPAFGAKGSSCRVVVSKAAMRYRFCPATRVNCPPMYSRFPSGDAVIASTGPSVSARKEPIRAPLRMS
jgi:hypothetical protein